jgi:hypothetical protein
VANPFEFDYTNFRDNTLPTKPNGNQPLGFGRRVAGILGVIFILSFIVDI